MQTFKNDEEKAKYHKTVIDVAKEMGEQDKTKEELAKIGELIRTQDNRITSHPMFAVQQKVRDWGYDSLYCDDYAWVKNDDEWIVADDEESEKLEEEDNEVYGDIGSWERVYYKDRWEYVTICLTEKACNDYIARNRHHLNEPRTYVYSGYRNYEWQLIREALMKGKLA